MKELNLKLAKWRWPDAEVHIPSRRLPGVGDVIRVRIDGQITEYEFFTSSLDVCFKELVPELGEWACIKFDAEYGEIWAYVSDESRGAFGQAETPALALCLAFEELIDAKKRRL